MLKGKKFIPSFGREDTDSVEIWSYFYVLGTEGSILVVAVLQGSILESSCP